MRSRTVPSALAAGALLLGGLLSGCGGGDDSSASPSEPTSSATDSTGSTGTDAGSGDSGVDAGSSPTDASAKDFCTTYAAIVNSGESDLATEKAAVTKLAQVGTPKDMPADARKGYELLVDAIAQAKSEAELTQLGEQLDQSQTSSLLTFSQYLTTTCATELGLGDSAPTSGATGSGQ